jgi:DNA-binding beta-propeller fold protein YncE
VRAGRVKVRGEKGTVRAGRWMVRAGGVTARDGTAKKREVHVRLVMAAALCLVGAAAMPVGGAEQTMPAAPAAGTPAKSQEMTSVALPGAPADGVSLDYLAVDRARHRVWVPAGGTGSVVVIDTQSGEVRRVAPFPTKEVEWRGRKRIVGPSSATIGDGYVYVGDRADMSVCAIDAAALEKSGCVTLPGSPDGVVFVPRSKEVWVTTPRDNAIVVLDVSAPAAPKIAGRIALDGQPEGYAVDDARGYFYTNFEDADRTLRLDVATRKVIATWKPACGEEGPRGLALEPGGRWLMVACTDHVKVLDGEADGRIVSKLETGPGVDNIDYLPARRLCYAAASGAATLTLAHLDEKGGLASQASLPTARGARNAVASEDGVAYVADGPEGKILVVRPPAEK